jgi:hypothetical protein
MHSKNLYGPNDDDEDHQGSNPFGSAEKWHDIGQGIKSFGSGVSRFISGNNDWTAPTPTISTTGFGAATPGYSTEADYQKVLQQQAYYQQHPDEFAKLSPDYQKWLLRPAIAPEADPYQAQLNLTRTYTNPLLGQLQQAAAGQGPSQAQDTLRAGTARTISSQYGMAATPSVGGAQQAALVGNAQWNAGQAQQEGARQAAQLRAQEMTDARQQLGGLVNQASGQFMTQAGMNLEREKANQNAAMGINTLN